MTQPTEVKKITRTRHPLSGFDFASVEVAAAPAPVRKGGRGGDPLSNPFLRHIDASWNERTGQKGSGKAVTVPENAVREAINLIRRAATFRELGVATEQDGPGTKRADGSKVPAKHVQIRFAAKVRKQKRDKKTTATA